jgi:hypothetical protein
MAAAWSPHMAYVTQPSENRPGDPAPSLRIMARRGWLSTSGKKTVAGHGDAV